MSLYKKGHVCDDYYSISECNYEYKIPEFFMLEDVKEFIRKLKVDIDEVANKTDIWDNERWNKFRRLLLKRIKEEAGKELTEEKGK